VRDTGSPPTEADVRRSVRFRITAAAVLVVAAVLLAAGAVLVALQRASLTDGIDRTLEQRGDDVESLISTGDIPPDGLAQINEGFVQILAPDGGVALSTQNLANEPPLIFPVDAPFHLTVPVPVVDDDRFRVHGRVLEDGTVMFVAASFDQVEESSSALVSSLALALPIVLGVLAGLVWWLVGRTLEPVEAIRSEVAGFGSRDLHRRVPTSGTGDEIDRLAVTMNEMLSRLEISIEQQQQFVADASHELRSPLTRLRSQIELEMRIGGGAEATLESLHEDVIEMQRIVEDLLYLARMDAGQTRLTSATLDFDDIVLGEAEKAAMNAGIDVHTRGVMAVSVIGDEIRLRRAVSNLLENAVRHAEARVVLELRNDGDWAVLEVRDDGSGVPAGVSGKIFERFGRGDESRSSTVGGTGLGLAIARDIAAAHGGSVELLNPGDEGAIFELRLPAVAD
jgi:signal transduction histidine kinase